MKTAQVFVPHVDIGQRALSDSSARITQVGDGFVASIAHAGSGNSGTVFQH